jgi:hypothetical protein
MTLSSESIEFASARIFAMPTDGGRVIAGILSTDIVDSTSPLRRPGDSAWRNLLTAHNQGTREEHQPVSRARDPDYRRWLSCLLDGPARAVRCAQAMSSSLSHLGIAIRAGIHTGEIELVGTDVRGLAVREAPRVAGAPTAG